MKPDCATDAARRTRKLALCLALLSSAAVPTAALAEDKPVEAPVIQEDEVSQDDVIVVTAEKRGENIQTVPIAISAYSQNTLVDRNITSIESLRKIAPSFQSNGSSQSAATNYQIRGIGAYAGEEPAVAQAMDRVVYTTQGFGNLAGLGTVSFMDIERLEVVRGPQGTLGGRNATAGGIYVTSRRPTDSFDGYVRGMVGSYNRLNLEGAFGGPIAGDKLMVRMAFRSDRADGWVKNTLLGEDIFGIDQREVRFSVLARPADNFEALLILSADENRARGNIVAGGRARPDRPSINENMNLPLFDFDERTVQLDEHVYTRQKRFQGTLHLDWTLGGVKLSSTTALVDRDTLDGFDEDGTSVPSFTISPPGLFGNARQFSQELTLAADLGRRADIIAGGLYSDYTRNSGGTFGIPLSGIPAGQVFIDDLKTLKSWSIYAQGRYRITDELRLTAGARYTHDEKRGSGNQILFGGLLAFNSANEGKWSALTPRVSLDWQPSDHLTVYATASRGFKSGGIEMVSFPARVYQPEYVWNYEAGVKFAALDRRLNGTITVFYMDYTNLQQTVAGLDPGQLSFRVVNASSAGIKGQEITLDAKITDNFRLSFAGAHLDAKYTGLRTYDPLYPELGTIGPAGLPVRDLSGNQLAGAPEWQFNIDAEIKAPVSANAELVFQTSYAWQDRRWSSIYNHPGQFVPAGGLLDASVAVQTTDRKWRGTLFVTNLADKLYPAQGGTSAYTGANGAAAFYILGDPRRFGLRVERNF